MNEKKDVIETQISPETIKRDALEEAFWVWWADNAHALENGYAGDVSSLRDALNAASAKASISFCDKPRQP